MKFSPLEPPNPPALSEKEWCLVPPRRHSQCGHVLRRKTEWGRCRRGVHPGQAESCYGPGRGFEKNRLPDVENRGHLQGGALAIFFAEAINDSKVLKALPRELSVDPPTGTRSKQAVLPTPPTAEVARPPPTVTNATKSIWIQNGQGQKMVQKNLNVFQRQIILAETHTEKLIMFIRADADLKLRDKEQELILLEDCGAEC